MLKIARRFFLAAIILVFAGCCSSCTDYSQYETLIVGKWPCSDVRFSPVGTEQNSSYEFICNENNTWRLIDVTANDLVLCKGTWEITYASKPPEDYVDQSFSHHTVSGDLFVGTSRTPAGSFEYEFTKMFSSGELKYLDDPVLAVEIRFDGQEVSFQCQDTVSPEEKWVLTYQLNPSMLVQ